MRLAAWLAALVVVSSVAEHAMAGTTTTFPFLDDRLLRDGELRGGGVFVPSPKDLTNDESDAPRAVVVLLHGTNDGGPLHRWLGAPGIDLRPAFEGWVRDGRIAPAVLAAPSQTRDASSGSRLWPDFDLDAFVAATAAAIPSIALDRARVVLVGHSGAGCNENGGLLSSRGQPLARVAIDTCMDARFGELFARAADHAPFHVFFQPAIWPRPFDQFEEAFRKELALAEARVGTVTRIAIGGDDPHNVIVPSALERVLPQLLAPSADAS